MNCGAGRTPDAPIGVLSAVLVDEARPDRTLLGVRRPTALSPRHPGVLSTPTIRLPGEVFGLLTDALTGWRPVPGSHPVGGPEHLVGGGGRFRSATSYAVESLLAAKLGLADPLGDGRFTAIAQPRYWSLEEVGDPLGTGLSEWTAMLTYELRVSAGGATVPASTGAYSRLLWVPSERLPQALATHDALLLDETLNAIEVCVQGLCVRVATEVLAHRAP